MPNLFSIFQKSVAAPLVINTKTEKDPPVDADLIVIEDSADPWAQKKVQIGNLPHPTPPFVPEYIRLHDSKASGTHGGTFTTGAWQKRTITEDQDTGNNVSVASSVITLESGTYDCLIHCPANRVAGHKARLRNTSDSSTTLLGSNEDLLLAAGSGSNSVIKGRFTIAAQKNFEIQHRCQSTVSTDGFGVANSFGENEIYTVAEFWKVAT